VTTYDSRPEPLDVEKLLGVSAGTLCEKMDIQFHKLTAEHSIASMPVAGNTQSIGILHGGAFVVLGESLGSISANIHAHAVGGHNQGSQSRAVGIEINATHTGSGTDGFVIGECRALHLGRTLTTHEIIVTNQAGKRLSTVRITNLIKTARD
jgi:1,4-dihydroxy-2-naphthoyl-CoA hydrolase